MKIEEPKTLGLERETLMLDAEYVGKEGRALKVDDEYVWLVL